MLTVAPPEPLPSTGPMNEFTLLSSVDRMSVYVPPASLIPTLRLVATTVLMAWALTSTTPALTLAPSPMYAWVVVATLLSRRTALTAAKPMPRAVPSRVEFDVDVAWTLMGRRSC